MSRSAVGILAMTDGGDFEGVGIFQVEEHAVVAATETKTRERGPQLFHIAAPAGKVAIHTEQNLHS